MGVLKDLKDMLSSDDSNKLSSKRVITFIAFLLVSIAFVSNLYFDVIVEDSMYDGMIQIVWAGLGVVVGEHLLKKKNGDKPE
tara:strand:- start:3333 stop:3578 length:246 start_codon:yes stop_codon:yes gene_type:complete